MLTYSYSAQLEAKSFNIIHIILPAGIFKVHKSVPQISVFSYKFLKMLRKYLSLELEYKKDSAQQHIKIVIY